jgi:hypothetical protein
MRTGKLIRVESRRQTTTQRPEFELGFGNAARHAEFFWLCADCSSKGLMLQKDGSIAGPLLFARAAGSGL